MDGTISLLCQPDGNLLFQLYWRLLCASFSMPDGVCAYMGLIGLAHCLQCQPGKYPAPVENEHTAPQLCTALEIAVLHRRYSVQAYE